MRKVERLVNLTALLLDTPRPLTLDEVAEMVPGYEASGESLRRMFERDKEELRGLGVPVERAAMDAWGSDEGYFIDPKAYGMPELRLDPDERAATPARGCPPRKTTAARRSPSSGPGGRRRGWPSSEAPSRSSRSPRTGGSRSSCRWSTAAASWPGCSATTSRWWSRPSCAPRRCAGSPGSRRWSAMPQRSQRTPDASAAGRLQRLLALVPWVMSRPDATVEEVCARFSITREALMADLELLFVSGVPPYGPGDLIEAWVDGDRVHIGLAGYFARAPRLTWREAAGLYLAGRALAALPEVDEEGALTRALAKLEAVLPADQLRRVQELGSKVSVELDGDPVERERRAALAKAAAASRRVVIEYYTGSRGELTRRK